MRYICTAALLLALVISSTGCKDDNPAEADSLTLSDLTGSWKASSMVFTNKANSSQTFDLVANGGELRITVLSGGRARTWLEFGPVSDEWDAQLSLDGDQVTSTPAEASRDTETWTVELSGNTLTMTNDDTTFDFTLTGGAEVPASVRIVLVPNV